MTVADVATHQDNCGFAWGGAQVRAQRRHLATVVHVRGEIDGVNVDGIRDHIRRFTVDESPVILDLSDANLFAGAEISLIFGFDDDCRAAGVEWTLVAGSEVADAVRASVPVAASVPAAMCARADAVARLRQLVTPLVRRTA